MDQAKRSGWLNTAIVVIGCLMVLYHLVTTQRLIVGIYQHQAIHLGFALTLVFLSTLRNLKKTARRPVLIALMVMGIVTTSYIVTRAEYLSANSGFIRNWVDGAVGIALVVVVMEACRQAWGWVLPIVISVLVAYFFLGHLLPPPLEHTPFPPAYVLSMLGIGLDGIIGDILGISANYVFLFCVFGGLIVATNSQRCFIEIGRAIGRFITGGTAYTAIVSSLLVGMVMGQAVSNAALVGNFTIPMMKKSGFSPTQAAAIEACASSGGQIMPPVMGAAVFIMASFLNMPYWDIAVVSFFPAVLYFVSVGFGVRYIALKYRIPTPAEKVDVGVITRLGPIFFVPLAVIFVILMMRFTPMYAAFWAIIATLLVPLFRKSTRIPIMSVLRGLADGALVGASIAVACGAIGMMVKSFTNTMLGTMIAQWVETVSGDYLLLALVMTMIVSIILGTGLPTPAAYIIVAITVTPVLVTLGVIPLAAHMFNYWFAVFSSLTPPVAFASMTTAAIAGAKLGRVGVLAMWLGVGGFILPFAMVYSPALLLRPAAGEIVWLQFLAVTLVFLAFNSALYNCLFVINTRWERVIFGLAAVLLFVYFVTRDMTTFGIATFILAVGIVVQWRRFRVARRVEEAVPALSPD